LYQEVQVKEAESNKALSELYRLEKAHTGMGERRGMGQGSTGAKTLKTTTIILGGRFKEED
jgi:hypothetical protein